MRRPTAVPYAGVGLGVVGFVLLVIEVARTLSGNALGGIGSILLWVGFGLLAVGLVASVLTLSTETSPDATAPDATAPGAAPDAENAGASG